MTKKLEDLLNLPDSKEMIEEEQLKKQAVIAEQDNTFREIDELDNEVKRNYQRNR